MSFQQLSSLLNSTGFLAAIVGAVVGGLIAGGFTVWSQGQSNKAQRRRDREADNEQIKGTLHAIATELETFKARFVDAFRRMFVEPDQQKPYAHLPKIVGFRHPYWERIRYQQEFSDREVGKEEIENWAERIRTSIPDLEKEISDLLVDIRKYLIAKRNA
jgi:hypothetical protein